MKRANNKCEWEGCEFNHTQEVWSTRYQGNVVWSDSIATSININPHQSPKKVRVILTVAHLDHDETNMDVQDDRLMAMCQLHHLRYDTKEKVRRKISLQ